MGLRHFPALSLSQAWLLTEQIFQPAAGYFQNWLCDQRFFSLSLNNLFILNNWADLLKRMKKRLFSKAVLQLRLGRDNRFLMLSGFNIRYFFIVVQRLQRERLQTIEDLIVFLPEAEMAAVLSRFSSVMTSEISLSCLKASLVLTR